jgi:hypothetical protein
MAASAVAPTARRGDHRRLFPFHEAYAIAYAVPAPRGPPGLLRQFPTTAVESAAPLSVPITHKRLNEPIYQITAFVTVGVRAAQETDIQITFAESGSLGFWLAGIFWAFQLFPFD